MKTIVLGVVITVATGGLALATPSRVSNGTVTFSTCTVSGIPAFTVQEKLDLISIYGSGSIVWTVPTFFETAISTTMGGLPAGYGYFSNNSDFQDLVTNKTAIEARFVQFEQLKLAYADAFAAHPTVNLQPRINKFQAIIDLLYSVYFSLP